MSEYAPALVLIIWAVLWAAGVQGDGVIVAGLLLEAAAIAAHIGQVIR